MYQNQIMGRQLLTFCQHCVKALDILIQRIHSYHRYMNNVLDVNGNATTASLYVTDAVMESGLCLLHNQDKIRRAQQVRFFATKSGMLSFASI